MKNKRKNKEKWTVKSSVAENTHFPLSNPYCAFTSVYHRRKQFSGLNSQSKVQE